MYKYTIAIAPLPLNFCYMTQWSCFKKIIAS